MARRSTDDVLYLYEVVADDLKVEWLTEHTDDVDVGISCGPAKETILAFSNRGEAARFADRLVELIAVLPDKEED